MINKYFQNGFNIGEASEQQLLASLVMESIQIFGYEVYYIPRTSVKQDLVFGEDVLSQFTDAVMIEAYLGNIEGWGGNGELLGKFGLEVQNDAQFIISRDRWLEVTENVNVQLPSRPDEGALIFFPLTNAFFEIRFVNHLQPFYQLSNFYVFTLECSMFRYSSETIATGNTIIDQFAKNDSMDTLDYMLTDQTGTPITDASGDPIIGSGFDTRVPQPYPNDAKDFEDDAENVVNFDEDNLFGNM